MAKPLRFLIAGLGSIGRRHLHNLNSLGEKDITLFRSHLSTLPDEELKPYPVENDLKKSLTHSPDAVIVSNPTALHLDIAIPAAIAGCHLFIEKPLSQNLNRLKELEEAVRSTKVKVFVGFQYRFHPSLKIIKELLNEKAIGRVIYTRCQWSEYLPGWHPWEDYRKGYSARSDLGGGVVLTLCHPIDYLHWLLGDINFVSAITSKLSDLEIQVEDCAEIIMQFKESGLCSLHLDYIQQPPQHFLEITGTQGLIKWDNQDGIVKIFRNAAMEWEEFYPEVKFKRNDLFLSEMNHFIDLVNGKTESLCTLQDGIFVQKVIDAIYRSSQAGCQIKI